MKKLIVLIVSAMLLLTSCGGKTDTSDRQSGHVVINTVTVYYADENAEGLISEEKEVLEKNCETALEALLAGPNSAECVEIIGAGTYVLGTSLDSGVMTVDLSNEFMESYGDTLAIYSIVNTLTEFEEVNFVRITVNGAEDAVLGNYVLSELFTRNDSIIIK